jgi:hypothetical protein
LTRFTENFSIIEMARAQRVESFAAIAYKNLSQEYQALGALQVALQYARESVRVVDASMGSRDEAFCRLQLATVLGELEMTPELEMELQACSAADFPEIRSAVALLENYYFGAEHKIDLNALSPIWKVRASSKDWCGPVLGELAGQLVALLSRGPLTRVEILDQLFSDIKDEASRVIRFQGMVARIRRKSPDLIYFEEPLYWLQKPEKGVSE